MDYDDNHHNAQLHMIDFDDGGNDLRLGPERNWTNKSQNRIVRLSTCCLVMISSHVSQHGSYDKFVHP